VIDHQFANIKARTKLYILLDKGRRGGSVREAKPYYKVFCTLNQEKKMLDVYLSMNIRGVIAGGIWVL